MQLLGKHYFGHDDMTNCLPDAAEASDNTMDLSDEDGLEELCDAVSGERHIPAWMAAAAGMVRSNRRHLVTAASVLVIGFAVYLNWTMAGGGTGIVDETDTAGDAALTLTDGVAGDPVVGELSSPADGAAEDDYFALSQINRQRARDEAIAVLQDVVEGSVHLGEVQSDALSQISQIAADIEHEAAIESLVRGKGFAECVAVISGDNANVIVRTDALLPNEVVQIQEIVYETAGILPVNVKIIEK